MSNGKPTARYNYLSSEFQLYESTKSVIDFMKLSNLFNDQDIDRFNSAVDHGYKELNHQKYDWSDGDGKLPMNWKMRTTDCSNGVVQKYFLVPDGTSFTSLLNALQYMEKEGYAQEDINAMSMNLFDEGWMEHEKIPRGWHIKLSQKLTVKNNHTPPYFFLTDNLFF